VVTIASATLVVAGCGEDPEPSGSEGPGRSTAAGERAAPDPEADRSVAAAIAPVLSEDDPFRAHVTGSMPFTGEVDEVWEQSGDDFLEVSASSGLGSVTVGIGPTIYEWYGGDDATWDETPRDSWDPLMGPGFGFGLNVMIGLLEPAPGATEPEDLASMVATGWAEVDGAPEGRRRFERVLDTGVFRGDEARAEDSPRERLEEDAVSDAFYDHARVISAVEVDDRGRLARTTLRFDFDGVPGHERCAPLRKLLGTSEVVSEFSSVGTPFEIRLPRLVDLIASHPELGESNDLDMDDLLSGGPFDGPFADAYAGEDGERDLSGCPTP
jgi:hypothetical protein